MPAAYNQAEHEVHWWCRAYHRGWGGRGAFRERAQRAEGASDVGGRRHRWTADGCAGGRALAVGHGGSAAGGEHSGVSVTAKVVDSKGFSC